MPRVKLTNRNLLRIGDEDILFDHGKVLLAEAIEAEKVAGMTWPQILAGLQVGVAQAILPVVYIMRKRSNHKLRPSEVVFSMDEYELLDPDFEPEYWVLTADDDPLGVLVDDEGNRVQDNTPETDDEAPKADPQPTET